MICPFQEKRGPEQEAEDLQSSRTYASSEMERMMKVQEVLLRAMAKKIICSKQQKSLAFSARTMRRWRERLQA